MQPGPETLDLQEALGILRRRMGWIVACVLLIAAAAYGFSKGETKKYTATAALSFNTDSLSSQIAGLQSDTGSGSLAAQEVRDVELVRLGDMAIRTASLLGHGLTPEKVGTSVSVNPQGESGIIDVSATSASPSLAAAIANTYTRQFVQEQQSSRSQYFRSALAVVEKQLAALSPEQRVGADGLTLQNRAQTLSLLAELHYDNVQVAEQAFVPGSPSSPSPAKSALLGALLGMLLGLGLVFVLEHVDRRIRGPKDIEAVYRVPLLGAVPTTGTIWRSLRQPHVHGRLQAEAFALIRAQLRMLKGDRQLRTVGVVSASPGEGKTTAARRLGEAAARSGLRVLVVEADLRNPKLAQRLGLEATPGLVDVLSGKASLEAATQQVDLGMAGQAGHRRMFDVLTAGVAPGGEPGDLFERPQMGAMLEHAKAGYDLIVVDPAPLATVSDGLPLLDKLDGVLVVTWVGRSRREAAERLRQILDRGAIPLLGVIANGLRTRGVGRYGPPENPADSGPRMAPPYGTPPDELLPPATVQPRAGTALS